MAKFANISAGAGKPPPVPLLPPASLVANRAGANDDGPNRGSRPCGVDGLSLFLDFDGTLVNLAARPDAVDVAPTLPVLLYRLADRLDGRIALISGRGASHIASFIGHLPITIAGSHGAEIRYADGRTLSPPRPSTLAIVLGAFHDLARTTPGVLVEDKPHGVALHYRGAPDAAALCHAVATGLSARLGLHLQTGKMMVELRGPGADKGMALNHLMQDPAMQGTTPLFMGDDDTDEPAFVAANQLGGAGVLVGPGRHTTAAQYALSGVAAVHAWLESLVEL